MAKISMQNYEAVYYPEPSSLSARADRRLIRVAQVQTADVEANGNRFRG